MRFLQWFPEWGHSRTKIRNISSIYRYPTHHAPRTFVIPYDGWLDVLEADALRGVPDGKEDYRFLDDYDGILTLILGDNIGSTAWLRKNYPDKKLITIIEPFPPVWYVQNAHGIMTNPYGFRLMKKDILASDITMVDSCLYDEPLREIYGTDKIYWSPNPVAVDYIKGFMDLSKRRRDLIGAGQHCNFPQTLPETVKVLNIFKNRGTIERWLFNSNVESDKRFGVFDKYIPFKQDHKEHLREQNQISIFVDNCTGACSIQSRRCAAMGIPTIGNNIIGSHVQICPDLVSRPQDYYGMALKLTRLINDEDFYQEQVRKTLINIEKYNYNNCKERLFKIMQERDIL